MFGAFGEIMGVGSMLMRLADATDQKRKSEKLARIDDAIRDVDDTLNALDEAVLRLQQGAAVDYQGLVERVRNPLEAARTRVADLDAPKLAEWIDTALSNLDAVRAASYLPASMSGYGGRRKSVAGLGFAPLGPAFGPGLPGGGMGPVPMLAPPGPVTVTTPQSFTTAAASIAQRTVGANLNRIRPLLRAVRQVLTQIRTGAAAAAGLGAAPMWPAPVTQPVFGLATFLWIGLAGAAAYHGHKRGGVGGAVKWSLAPLLLGVPGGIVTNAIAVSQGFGKGVE